MRFDYGSVGTGLTTLSKRVVVAVGVCSVPLIFWAAGGYRVASAQSRVEAARAAALPQPDPRISRLTRFFAKLNSPVLNLSHVFVKAADENHLDWRLLPSISVVESGGGKAYRNNNIFGWDGGLQFFPSISTGIEIVASKLGHSPLYRNRDSVQKLRVYNPNESYVHDVVNVMNRISPAAELVRN